MVVTRRQAAARRDSLSSQENGTPSTATRRDSLNTEDYATPSAATDTISVASIATKSDIHEEQDDVVTERDDKPNTSSPPLEIASRSSSKKWGIDFWKRLASGLVLSSSFIALIYSGHIWVCIGVIIMEVSFFVLSFFFCPSLSVHLFLFVTNILVCVIND